VSLRFQMAYAEVMTVCNSFTGYVYVFAAEATTLPVTVTWTKSAKGQGPNSTSSQLSDTCCLKLLYIM